MLPPKTDETTPEERRQWIRNTFPCISDCDRCGLCTIYRGRDVEHVYEDYIKGIKSFEEIAKAYKR